MSTDVMTNLHFWVALFLAGRCAWVLGAGALFELGDSVIGDRKSFPSVIPSFKPPQDRKR
jgi:hypothetical protein